jgi:hypothetical protein
MLRGQEPRVADEPSRFKAADQKQVCSDDPIRERREHPEHLLGGGTRPAVRPTKGLR